jgi:hypothetical protein
MKIRSVFMILAIWLAPAVGFSNQYELTKRMDSTIIPQVNFSGMELSRVIEVLAELSKEYSPDRKAVNYKVFLPAGGGSYDPLVNISLRQLSLSKITTFIAQQINCKVSYAKDGSYVIFNAPYVKPSLADKAREIRGNNPDWNTQMDDYDLVREFLRFHPDHSNTFDIPTKMLNSVTAQKTEEIKKEQAEYRQAQAAQLAAQKEAKTQEARRQAFVAPQGDLMPNDAEAKAIRENEAMRSRRDDSAAEHFINSLFTEGVIIFFQSKAMAWANLVNGILTLLTSLVLTVYLTYTRAESLLSRLAIFVSFTFCFLVTLITGLSTGAFLDKKKFEEYFLPLIILAIISLVIPFALMHVLRWVLAAKDGRERLTPKARFKFRAYGRLSYFIQVTVLSGLVGGLANFITVTYTNWLMIFMIIYIWFILAPRRAKDAGMPQWLGYTVGIPIMSIYSNYICLGAQKDYASADRIDAKGLALVIAIYFLGGMTLCGSSAFVIFQHQ